MPLRPSSRQWHRSAVAGIVLGACAVSLASDAAALDELRSTSVQLPESDRTFPPGPGADVVDRNCLTCHSAGMVLNQPALSRPAWAAEVGKMINTYKAPVAQEDVGPIVEYLTHLNASP